MVVSGYGDVPHGNPTLASFASTILMPRMRGGTGGRVISLALISWWRAAGNLGSDLNSAICRCKC